MRSFRIDQLLTKLERWDDLIPEEQQEVISAAKHLLIRGKLAPIDKGNLQTLYDRACSPNTWRGC